MQFGESASAGNGVSIPTREVVPWIGFCGLEDDYALG